MRTWPATAHTSPTWRTRGTKSKPVPQLPRNLARLTDLSRACPRSERLEKLCRKLCRKLYRNARKLTDSSDKVRDKVRDKDALGGLGTSSIWVRQAAGDAATGAPMPRAVNSARFCTNCAITLKAISGTLTA